VYVVFDTETTGLPRNMRAPASDIENWPRIVQLAWAAYDTQGQLTEAESHIVRPDGFTIPDDATRVHGITTAQASRDGRDIREVVKLFASVIRRAQVLVSHNMQFDENVVAAESYRIGQPIELNSKVRLCTKVTSTAYCRIPGQYGFKWPKLSELHAKLFGSELQHAHDAAADVAACAKCFFELKRLGVILAG